MAESMLKNMRPIHPGELLREDILPAVARPKAEIARLLGISRQTLYDIINERQPVTAQMALRLAKMFGGGPEVWINMQRTYDLKIARLELGDALDKIPELRAA
ncbi:HigA family addiction module antitoxin [Parasphingorhabdus sp.]|uniref:HigA family addiction module antitoxin n=1 Tax=Parasphingorhabdus sp. TaxID=2709688 RepID=UPI003594296A